MDAVVLGLKDEDVDKLLDKDCEGVIVELIVGDTVDDELPEMVTDGVVVTDGDGT